jgi:hypothetical protein
MAHAGEPRPIHAMDIAWPELPGQTARQTSKQPENGQHYTASANGLAMHTGLAGGAGEPASRARTRPRWLYLRAKRRP